MVVFDLGKTFPLHNKANGSEFCRCQLTDSFFDIVYYLPNPSERDINAWRKAPIEYGIFESQNIPFFISNIKTGRTQWVFETTINVHLIADEMADVWLNLHGQNIRLFLINGHTNVLEAFRLITVQKADAERIKDVCMAQDYAYENANAVDLTITKIMDSLTVSDMMSRTAMKVVKNGITT